MDRAAFGRRFSWGVPAAVDSYSLTPMRTLLHRAAALALLANCSLPMAAPASPIKPEDLSCQFQASARADGRVVLGFTLRNAGKQDLHLLRWGTPFEGAWFGPFVHASTPQGELPFQGAMRKRGDPSAQDYLLLRAGQTLSAELTLNDAFAVPPNAVLRLKAGWHWHDIVTPGSGKPPRPRAQHSGLDQDCGEATVGP